MTENQIGPNKASSFAWCTVGTEKGHKVPIASSWMGVLKDLLTALMFQTQPFPRCEIFLSKHLCKEGRGVLTLNSRDAGCDSVGFELCEFHSTTYSPQVSERETIHPPSKKKQTCATSLSFYLADGVRIVLRSDLEEADKGAVGLFYAESAPLSPACSLRQNNAQALRQEVQNRLEDLTGSQWDPWN